MRERMLRGELYQADDPELRADYLRAQALVEQFNRTTAAEAERRAELLRALFGHLGDGVLVTPPLRCDYGAQVSVGAGTFVNYDCVFLDVAPIVIGPHGQLGPRVQLLTAAHPLEPDARRERWELGRPITIGENVWIGGGAIVCPGARIGENSVIGAGAVVTGEIPANVVAAGVPARVKRRLV